MTDVDVSVMINLGCGSRWNASWRNLDGGPWTKLNWLRSLPIPDWLLPVAIRRYPGDLVPWDLRRLPLPFADGSASVIFSQWVLEYLTVGETMRLLTECARVLAPGGLIRLNQTDIGAIVGAYAARDVGATAEAAERAGQFLAAAAPGHTTLSARLFRRGGVQQLFDRAKLEWMLLETGFADIRFHDLNQGNCPDLLELEHEWDPPLVRVEARRTSSEAEAGASPGFAASPASISSGDRSQSGSG